jgi:hypothetical protein
MTPWIMSEAYSHPSLAIAPGVPLMLVALDEAWRGRKCPVWQAGLAIGDAGSLTLVIPESNYASLAFIVAVIGVWPVTAPPDMEAVAGPGDWEWGPCSRPDGAPAWRHLVGAAGMARQHIWANEAADRILCRPNPVLRSWTDRTRSHTFPDKPDYQLLGHAQPSWPLHRPDVPCSSPHSLAVRGWPPLAGWDHSRTGGGCCFEPGADASRPGAQTSVWGGWPVRSRFSSKKYPRRVQRRTSWSNSKDSSPPGTSVITGPKIPGPLPPSRIRVGTPNA